MNMKDYIADMKQKPEHVRKRIAMGASAGVTGLIALIWGGTMIANGALAIGTGVPTSSDTPSTDAFALSGTDVKSNFNQLLGAVGAATGSTSTKPALTIVDGGTSSSFATTSANAANNQSATSISF